MAFWKDMAELGLVKDDDNNDDAESVSQSEIGSEVSITSDMNYMRSMSASADRPEDISLSGGGGAQERVSQPQGGVSNTVAYALPAHGPVDGGAAAAAAAPSRHGGPPLTRGALAALENVGGGTRSRDGASSPAHSSSSFATAKSAHSSSAQSSPSDRGPVLYDDRSAAQQPHSVAPWAPPPEAPARALYGSHVSMKIDVHFWAPLS